MKNCDRDICATNEYNGIGCDECCVSYDIAVQREQDAYDSGFGKAIESVLEIIEKEIRRFEIQYTCDEMFTYRDYMRHFTSMQGEVKALKEEGEQR